MLFLDYFALSAGYMSFTTLKIIANLRYCSTCLLDSTFRLRPTIIAPSIITHNAIPFKTTYSHSNNRYHHRHYFIHTLQDYCSSKYYIPYLSVLNHKTLHSPVLYLPIVVPLSSITLGVCLIALNLNH
jgi:hypothetical protein